MKRAVLPVYAIVTLAAGFFVFAVLKAARLSVTWDEAFTYLEFIAPGRMYPGAGGGMAANNHLLNTWLASLTTGVFGPGEFVLRIPNLVFYLAFLYFTARISLSCYRPLAAVAAFLLFNANPYLIDFFCLARGYGLSFSLLAGSMVCLSEYSRSGKQRMFHMSLLCAMAAVTANLAMLHFAIAVFLAPVFIRRIYGQGVSLSGSIRQSLSANPRWLNVLFAAFLLCIVPYGIVLQRSGALFYGGGRSFYHDTLVSVADNLFYGRHYGPVDGFLLAGFFLFAFLWMTGFAIHALMQNTGRAPASYTVVLFVLPACAIMGIVQHYVFGTLYLIERSALYLFILFLFAIVEWMRVPGSRQGFIRFLPVLAAVVFTVHLLLSSNLRYVPEWRRDADVPQMIADLDSLRQSRLPKSVLHVGASLEYEQPFNYYIMKDAMEWLAPFNHADRFRPEMDYYVLDAHDRQAFPVPGLAVLKSYPAGATLLAGVPPGRKKPAAP